MATGQSPQRRGVGRSLRKRSYSQACAGELIPLRRHTLELRTSPGSADPPRIEPRLAGRGQGTVIIPRERPRYALRGVDGPGMLECTHRPGADRVHALQPAPAHVAGDIPEVPRPDGAQLPELVRSLGSTPGIRLVLSPLHHPTTAAPIAGDGRGADHRALRWSRTRETGHRASPPSARAPPVRRRDDPFPACPRSYHRRRDV